MLHLGHCSAASQGQAVQFWLVAVGFLLENFSRWCVVSSVSVCLSDQVVWQLCWNRQYGNTEYEAVLFTEVVASETELKRSCDLQRKPCLSPALAPMFPIAGGSSWSVLGAGSPAASVGLCFLPEFLLWCMKQLLIQ